MYKQIKTNYKNHTIIVSEQTPSIDKPKNQEEWDKLYKVYGSECLGTHNFEIKNKNDNVIFSSKFNMWNDKACIDNAIQKIELILNGVKT